MVIATELLRVLDTKVFLKCKERLQLQQLDFKAILS